MNYAVSPNEAYTNYGDVDCTNFVSQCLFAGGMLRTTKPNIYNLQSMRQSEDAWFYYDDFKPDNMKASYSWSGAEPFRKYWKTRVYQYIEFTTPRPISENIEYWATILQEGDIIQICAFYRIHPIVLNKRVLCYRIVQWINN